MYDKSCLGDPVELERWSDGMPTRVMNVMRLGDCILACCHIIPRRKGVILTKQSRGGHQGLVRHLEGLPR